VPSHLGHAKGVEKIDIVEGEHLFLVLHQVGLVQAVDGAGFMTGPDQIQYL
jgi:hypothetical protein